MRTKLLLIFLTITTYSYCQEHCVVEYDGIWPSGRIYQGVGILEVKGTLASLYPKRHYSSNHNMRNDSSSSATYDGDRVINTQRVVLKGTCEFTTNDPYHFYFNMHDGVMYQVIDSRKQKAYNAHDTIFLLKEQLGTTHWNIFDEEKQIGSFLCKKAKGRVKGRTYTVWFAPEIPISLGPWKLNGLPGLILEAEDSLHEVSFSAKHIELDKKNSKEIKIPSVDILTTEDYANLRDKRLEELRSDIEKKSKRRQSRMPKGAKVKITHTIKEGGIELE